MTKAVLQFQTLAELAAYSRQVNLDAFVMDTKHLTLSSVFNENQFATAMKEYNAYLIRKTEVVQ